jgi:hypothetical protein
MLLSREASAHRFIEGNNPRAVVAVNVGANKGYGKTAVIYIEDFGHRFFRNVLSRLSRYD